MTRLKVCGITRPEDAELAVEVGAWAIGFILWQGSKRYHTDLHLLDSPGNGRTWDWGLAAERRSKVPLIIAGGLTPENVGEAIAEAYPWAVDVASGVEAEPGLKDPATVRAFAAAVAEASQVPSA